MSSSPRNTGVSNRYGSDGDYGKRRKSFYPSSTRRDFKSSSNSPSTLPATAAVGSSSATKPSLRADASTNNEYATRPRYRDSVSSGNSSSAQSSRQNSYNKDNRYGSYGSKYPYTNSYYQERNNGAYGSFSSAKRAENDSFGSNSTARDASSRDMVNGASSRTERQVFSRDSWGRSERPKLHIASGPKAAGSTRFNPNNIPLSSRNGSNGLSSSVSNNYKKERYESYEESGSTRWKSYSSPRGDRNERIGPSGPSSRFNTPKERIRSSGLTNSVGTPKRNDSYYSHRNHNNIGRYGRGSFNLETNDNSNNTIASSKAREPDAKSVSPLTEGYPGVSQSDESTVNTYNDQNPHYDESQEELHDEDDEEDEEEEDNEEDEDDEKDEDEDEDDEEDEGDQKDEKEENPTDVMNGIDSASDLKEPKHQITPEVPHSEPHSSDDTTIEYPDGCMFPHSRLEYEYLQLQKEMLDDANYPIKRTTTDDDKVDFANLPFYSYNLKSFLNSYESHLRAVRNNNHRAKKKQLALVSQYKAWSVESEIRRGYMEEQIKVLHPVDDEARKELEAIDIRVKLPEPEIEEASMEVATQTGRRGRRHGDSVTTEAEFQEILKSLKNEQNDDPVARARLVAADIPDLILDPIERQAFTFMDSNNFVHDKSKWEDRLNTDFETNFTEAEHDLFCDAFCRFPKRFGEISRFMGGIRAFGECVMHYYITKKAVNYKFLVSQYKKKTTSKAARRKKKVKSKSLPSGESFESPKSQVSTEERQPLEVIQHHVDEKIKKVDDELSGTFEQREEESHLSEPARKKSRANDGTPLEIPKRESSPHDGSEIRTRKERQILDQGPIDSTHLKQAESINENDSRQPQISTDSVDGRSTAEERKSIKHITSYWSITEVEEFPKLLNLHGSKWSEIAEKLTSKSSTMVKNYFQRNAQKFGWDQIVAHVDRFGPKAPVIDSNSEMRNELQPVTRGVKATVEPQIHYASSNNNVNIVQSQPNNVQGLAQPNPFVHANISLNYSPQQHQPHEIYGVSAKIVKEATPQSGIQKPSIKSLLNNDTTPQKNSEVAPPSFQRTNNLSSLLNAPSSPVPEHSPAPVADATSTVTKRNNSIESLLG